MGSNPQPVTGAGGVGSPATARPTTRSTSRSRTPIPPNSAASRVLLYSILSHGGREPRRALPGDVGYDLFVSEQVVIEPGAFVDVHSGVAVEFPSGVWGMLVGRSSTLRRRQLHVPIGIIDNGYRGELYAGAYNLGDRPVTIEVGERIAQLILMPMVILPMQEVVSLSETERGDRGFGATGG